MKETKRDCGRSNSATGFVFLMGLPWELLARFRRWLCSLSNVLGFFIVIHVQVHTSTDNQMFNQPFVVSDS